jgi:hypothetical protein
MSWRTDPLTPRQRIAIRLIEQYLGIQYTGNNTKGAGSAFIGEYYERAKRVRDGLDVQTMTNRQAVASLKQQKLLVEVDPWES